MSDRDDLRKQLDEIQDMLAFLMPDPIVKQAATDFKGFQRGDIVTLKVAYNSKKKGMSIQPGEVGRITWLGVSDYTSRPTAGIQFLSGRCYIDVENVELAKTLREKQEAK